MQLQLRGDAHPCRRGPFRTAGVGRRVRAVREARRAGTLSGRRNRGRGLARVRSCRAGGSEVVELRRSRAGGRGRGGVLDALVNGAPTAELAAAALDRIPLYVVCETIKFTDEAATAPGYDRVPLEQVTDVIPETWPPVAACRSPTI